MYYSKSVILEKILMQEDDKLAEDNTIRADSWQAVKKHQIQVLRKPNVPV
jgi:hypothetical protein